MAGSNADIEVKSNVPLVKEALENAVMMALEGVGTEAEGYAKQNVAPRVDTGRLRNSITHAVSMDEQAVYIGTNVEYAPYIELGTGIYASDGRGRKTPWVYKDPKTGKFRVTRGIPPQHMLLRAATEHTDEYRDIIKSAFEANE